MTPFQDDPDAPPSEEERRAAEELREALGDPARANEDAELARAVALAHAPREISQEEHEALLRRALAPGDAAKKKKGGVVIFVTFGLAAALSVAAGLALVAGSLSQGEAPVAQAPALPLLQVRSTQPLFSEPFPREGRASARIDRIAMARASDLRDNRFSRWGVR